MSHSLSPQTIRNTDHRSIVARLAAILFFVVSAIAVPLPASANTFESLDITVELQPDGSAVITEHRIFNADEGTEHYIPLTNLDGSEVTDFSVTEQGQPMTDVGQWDPDWSLEEKAGKYGINDISDGVELCFGIGELGKRDFTVTYRITDFVRNLDDGPQAIYWTFISPGTDPIPTFSLEVTDASGLDFSDGVKMWGYGFDGTTEIHSDRLTLNATTLNSRDRVTLLTIFEPATYKTQGAFPYTSISIQDRANIGADWNDDTESDVDWWGSTGSILSSIGGALTSFIPIAILAFLGIKVAKSPTVRHSFGSFSAQNTDIVRDIPDMEFIYAARFANFNHRDWLAAYLVKWVSLGYLTVQAYEEGLLFKRNEYGLLMQPGVPEMKMNPAERDLWNILKQAAGPDGLLEDDSVRTFYRKDRHLIVDWIKLVRSQSQAYLTDHGYGEMAERQFIITFKRFVPTEQGQRLIDQIHGLKRYFKNFSSIERLNHGNLDKWDDYRIWATFLGLGEHIETQFESVDPDYRRRNQRYHLALTAVSSISASADSGYSRSSSSSSGGGGFSSSGGGGGSIGGGGGGTR